MCMRTQQQVFTLNLSACHPKFAHLFLFLLSRRLYECICLFCSFFTASTLYIPCIAHRTCSSMGTYAQIDWRFPINSQSLTSNKQKKTITTECVLAEYQENYLFPSSIFQNFFYWQVCCYLFRKYISFAHFQTQFFLGKNQKYEIEWWKFRLKQQLSIELLSQRLSFRRIKRLFVITVGALLHL